MRRSQVLLADDCALIADQLRALLEPDFDVIAVVGDGGALVTAAETLSPDVIVTDITMPGRDGITAARDILQMNPDARIVFVTIHNDPALVLRGLATGALGYVLKLAAADDLIPAIQAALEGNSYVSRTVRDSGP